MKYLMLPVNQGMLPGLHYWTHLDRLVLMSEMSTLPNDVLVSFFKSIEHQSHSDRRILNLPFTFTMDTEDSTHAVIFKYDMRGCINIEQDYFNGKANICSKIAELETHEKLAAVEQMANNTWNGFEFYKTVEPVLDYSYTAEPVVYYKPKMVSYEDIMKGRYYYSVSKGKFIEINFGGNGFEAYTHSYYALQALFRMQSICLASMQYRLLEVVQAMMKTVSQLVNDNRPVNGIVLSYEHRYTAEPYKLHDKEWLNAVYKYLQQWK